MAGPVARTRGMDRKSCVDGDVEASLSWIATVSVDAESSLSWMPKLQNCLRCRSIRLTNCPILRLPRCLLRLPRCPEALSAY